MHDRMTGMENTAAALTFYGRMPGNARPDDPKVGARITADSRCTRCGGPFLAGHALRADLAPGMAGTARHTDCDDPKLENNLDDPHRPDANH
jgi:hypothetical protein